MRFADEPRHTYGLVPVRVRRHHVTTCLITSNDFVGVESHWIPDERRRVYCAGPEKCTYCERLPEVPRFHLYVAIWKPGCHPSVLELPGGVYRTFKSWKDAHGSMRGTSLRATRKGKGHNGHVIVVLTNEKMVPDAVIDLPISLTEWCRRFYQVK